MTSIKTKYAGLSKKLQAVTCALVLAGVSMLPVQASNSDDIEAAAEKARQAGGSGHYKAQMVMMDSLPDHTIYMPRDLSVFKDQKLPVVVWGNGGCMSLGNAFANFLMDVASHGYLVIANGNVGELPKFFRTPPKGAMPSPEEIAKLRASMPAAKTTSQQLLDSVDWAEAQNNEASSPLFGKLLPGKVAAAGQSCGGLQAIKASADPRIDTTVVLNSGTFPDGGFGMSPTEARKPDLKNLHAPVVYISGDESDIAFQNASDDAKVITHVPLFRAWQPGIGHGGTFFQPNGGDFAPVVVAWLDWHLKDKAESSQLFTGQECGLCTDPAWMVSHPIK